MLVFAYGTLKRGFRNHSFLSAARDDASAAAPLDDAATSPAAAAASGTADAGTSAGGGGKARSRFVDAARTVQKLRMTLEPGGEYPCLLEDDESVGSSDASWERHFIEGELFEVPESIMAVLDELEEVERGLYRRGAVAVRLSRDGSVRSAATYVYEHSSLVSLRESLSEYTQQMQRSAERG